MAGTNGRADTRPHGRVGWGKHADTAAIKFIDGLAGALGRAGGGGPVYTTSTACRCTLSQLSPTRLPAGRAEITPCQGGAKLGPPLDPLPERSHPLTLHL